ncbi:MAG: peptide chain release factor 2, partial [Candidatus Brennerbacteria bacterium]|nr:peptide chain release factor 2 [Candidatus Brennerbacteria bacterium]
SVLTEKIIIPEKDIKIEFYRSSGPGGQNVNKVETAVRIIHLPTGVSAASQAERSQVQNRERALRLLKAKLAKIMEEKKEAELSNLRVKVTPEWGHQIRSYVLHPYKMVRDHRTGVKVSNPDKVLEGDLDKFIEAEV